MVANPSRKEIATKAMRPRLNSQGLLLTPSLNSILKAYESQGKGDREMLLTLLEVKRTEDDVRFFTICLQCRVLIRGQQRLIALDRMLEASFSHYSTVHSLTESLPSPVLSCSTPPSLINTSEDSTDETHSVTSLYHGEAERKRKYSGTVNVEELPNHEEIMKNLRNKLIRRSPRHYNTSSSTLNSLNSSNTLNSSSTLNNTKDLNHSSNNSKDLERYPLPPLPVHLPLAPSKPCPSLKTKTVKEELTLAPLRSSSLPSTHSHSNDAHSTHPHSKDAHSHSKDAHSTHPHSKDAHSHSKDAHSTHAKNEHTTKEINKETTRKSNLNSLLNLDFRSKPTTVTSNNTPISNLRATKF